jgi:hypothetical protein
MDSSIKLPITGAEKSSTRLPEKVAITRSFPIQLKRRAVEARLIVGDHNRSAATVDLAVLKAVARAHRCGADAIIRAGRESDDTAGSHSSVPTQNLIRTNSLVVLIYRR